MTEIEERNRRVRECLHALDDTKRRPSQHSATHMRELLSEARELLYLLHMDLRGWEARDAADRGTG